MKEYYMQRLALIDMEIDKFVMEKKTIDYHLSTLYELREDLVVKLNLDKQDEHKGCCNHE